MSGSDNWVSKNDHKFGYKLEVESIFLFFWNKIYLVNKCNIFPNATWIPDLSKPYIIALPINIYGQIKDKVFKSRLQLLFSEEKQISFYYKNQYSKLTDNR